MRGIARAIYMIVVQKVTGPGRKARGFLALMVIEMRLGWRLR
jgi:hypothetical protein